MKRGRSVPRKLAEVASTEAADPDVWELRLYVAGKTAKSVAAFENLSRLCEEHLAGKYTDRGRGPARQPQLAKGDQIVAIPTLVRKLPQPIRKVIGDLSNVERTLVGLQLRPRQDSRGIARRMNDETQQRSLGMTYTLDQLLQENEDMRHRLEEAEDALRALQAGEADAVVVEAGGERVFTLEPADKPYWLLVAQMPQPAATLTADGTIISCNHRFADLLRRPLPSLLGQPIDAFVAPDGRPVLEACCATA